MIKKRENDGKRERREMEIELHTLTVLGCVTLRFTSMVSWPSKKKENRVLPYN